MSKGDVAKRGIERKEERGPKKKKKKLEGREGKQKEVGVGEIRRRGEWEARGKKGEKRGGNWNGGNKGSGVL